jgi:hypothetical protein
MVHSTGEERAVHLAREAIELVDAGHREVRVTYPTLHVTLFGLFFKTFYLFFFSFPCSSPCPTRPILLCGVLSIVR